MNNREHCKSIAETLDKIAAGELITCQECGEYIDTTRGGVYDAENDSFVCPHCGAAFDESDTEYVSMYDYFQEYYNLEWRLDSNKEYKSVSVMIACGGPNIYVDTGSCKVELCWWGSNAEYLLSYAARDAIDEMFSELWECC